MKQIKFSDNAKIGTVETHKDGYKIVRAKMARTGIQSYYRHELGDSAPMGNPNDIIKVYRPAEEVFASDAINGWSHVPITLDHPPELVNPDNFRDYAVGETTSIAHVDKDSGWLSLEFLVKDAASIEKIENGEYKELSGGYQAVIDFSPGINEDGEAYDALQRQIDPNHLALVRKGRAGSEATFGDNWGVTPATLTEESNVAYTKIMIGDKAVTVADADSATLTAIVKDAEAELAKTVAELDSARADLVTVTADRDALKADVEAAAAAVLAEKTAAVIDVRGAEFVEGKTPEYIFAAFDMLPENPAKDTLRDSMKTKEKAVVSDGVSFKELMKGVK